MPGPLLLVAALIAAAAWLFLFVLASAATEPKAVHPGPPCLELAGDEPPALVDMLTGGWKVSHAAVPATLLDLAARGFLEIQEVGPGRVICHVRQHDPAGLLPYERRVLDHMKSLAVDGVVPAEALTTGPKEQYGKWWSGFRHEVIADAKARGLSRNRWSVAIWGLFGLLALVPAGLFTVWLHFNTRHDSHSDPRPGAFIAVWLALMWLLGNNRDQRDTTRGREVAARWLGLREHLATDPVFPTLGPGAVAMWDRLLAYGAAFGLAHAAVRAIPMGREDDHHAWTSYGGAWRRVTVCYPRGRPAWGSNPWGALALAIVLSGVAVFIVWVSHIFRDANDGSPIGRAMGLFGWLLTFGWLIALIVFLRVAWFALTDILTPEKQLEGEVVRLREFSSSGREKQPVYYCAVYAGTGDKVDAWRVDSGIYHSLSQMARVRVRVTPRLGCVRSIDVEEVHTDPSNVDAGSDVSAPVAVLDEAAKFLRGKAGRDQAED